MVEQRSVVKSLVAEKCKSCKIYRRTCDVYGEGCFIKKKIFADGFNIGLALQA